jgi:hypothetical protein
LNEQRVSVKELLPRELHLFQQWRESRRRKRVSLHRGIFASIF